MRKLTFLLLATFSLTVFAEYKFPDAKIRRVLEAGSTPSFQTNYDETYAVEISYNLLPSIEFLSRPMLKLAGLRFNPQNFSSFRKYYNTGIKSYDMKSKKLISIQGPKSAVYGNPKFSRKGTKIAFPIERKNCVELWTADIKSGKAQRFKGLCLNTIMGSGITWIDDNHLLVRSRVKGQKMLRDSNSVPTGPVTMETTGKVAQNRTYQDLLKDDHDVKLFKHYTRVQLTVINIKDGSKRILGPSGIIPGYTLSPDHKYVKMSRLSKREPYSFVVPYYYFSQDLEVWGVDGKKIGTIAKLPVFDSLPIQGVPTGIREFDWHPSFPSKLIVTEALDKGDWEVKVPHRDMVSEINIVNYHIGKKRELFKTANRYSGMDFFEDGKRAVVWDYEREKKFLTGVLYDLNARKKIKDLWGYGVNDEYNKPGSLVTVGNRFHHQSVRPDIIDGEEWVYLSGSGATPEGMRPFLRRMNLKTKESVELFRSSKKSYERFVYFHKDKYDSFVTHYQSATESPRYYIRKFKSDKPLVYWFREDPAKVFTDIKREILHYERKDGVKLSGILYYPLGYKKGKKYPVVVSAYPRQYSTAREAGQVRGTSSRYSRPYGASNLYFLLKGYAVLQKAQMPIVGSPKDMNDTFLKQLKMNAEATVGALKDNGILDGDRVAVIGHSYGAFMVANLLTHTDLFKAGIARSGAYNRTLTPFGFQNERRTFWQAQDTYLKVSPFVSADKMKKPLLMIHGKEDPNSGTFPMQSERYFNALKANGANARLVLLPKEGHGYAAYETVSHVLWEEMHWLERYL